MELSVPQVINWLYSGRCNLSCGFCYGRFNPDTLSVEQKYQIVDKIAGSSVPKLTITGGEPLLGEGVFDIIKYAKSKGIFVSLHTNGILLDSGALNSLEGNVGRVSLAIDGSTDKMNYQMRGYHGYLTLNIELMSCLRERGVPVSIKTVATRKNIEDIPDIAAVVEPYQPDVWLISEFLPIRRGKLNSKEYELNRDEFGKLKDKLDGLPFYVAMDSSDSLMANPYFFLDSRGFVHTNCPEKYDDICIGSILEESVIDLWKRIVEINPVSDNYILRSSTNKPGPYKKRFAV